jgi:hypothetical protein
MVDQPHAKDLHKGLHSENNSENNADIFDELVPGRVVVLVTVIVKGQGEGVEQDAGDDEVVKEPNQIDFEYFLPPLDDPDHPIPNPRCKLEEVERVRVISEQFAMRHKPSLFRVRSFFFPLFLVDIVESFGQHALDPTLRLITCVRRHPFKDILLVTLCGSSVSS